MPEGHDVMQGETGLDDKKHKKEHHLLDELLGNAKLYQQSHDYLELLQFVIRLHNLAPFNAMLLHIQKPSVRYVATKFEWEKKFNRTLKQGARPLIILWPFYPVAFVYDVEDTLGEKLPNIAFDHPFSTRGNEISAYSLKVYARFLRKNGIEYEEVDTLPENAGGIRKILTLEKSEKPVASYCIKINSDHTISVKFATLVHELGHLFLGHLGDDTVLKITGRLKLTHAQKELEAESLSYLVCSRCDIWSNSEQYLAGYVKQNTQINDIDIYHLMKAAGNVERLLNVTDSMQFRD